MFRSVASVSKRFSALRKTNQMEREMCSYLVRAKALKVELVLFTQW